MTPESSDLTVSRKEKTPHATLIEASCAPMFGNIKDSLGIDLTSEKILQFAESSKVKNKAVQLAVHICEILLSEIRDEQSGNAHIHTTRDIREKIRYISESHGIQSQELVRLHAGYDLPLVINSELFELAKEFIAQL